jgi:hypothetical protein
MKLTPIKANMTEIEIGDKTILFSYKTPVAYYENGKAYQTSKKWSVTTSRHINQWLKSIGEETIKESINYIEQSELDNLVK